MTDFGFHYRNGFHWKRLDDGSVLLTKTTTQAVEAHRAGISVADGIDPDQIVAHWSLTIDPDSWASIVTAVSAHPSSFAEALAFHMRDA